MSWGRPVSDRGFGGFLICEGWLGVIGVAGLVWEWSAGRVIHRCFLFRTPRVTGVQLRNRRSTE